MEYADYLREVDRAADATGGPAVSLAGGYFGVQLAADGANVVLALDLDTDCGWVAWTEDRDGERCCDAAEEVIGDCPLDEPTAGADSARRARARLTDRRDGAVLCLHQSTDADRAARGAECEFDRLHGQRDEHRQPSG